MEAQEFFTPEMISGMIGGAMVAVALLFARGVAWLKSLVMTTPTKIDDKAYNALVKAFTDAGVITTEQAAAATVDKPKGGGLKLQASPFATAAAIALLGLSAGGCSALDPLQDMGGGPRAGATAGATPGAAEGDDGSAWLDDLADGIVPADTAAGRAVRICLFSAVAAELYTFRLEYYGADLDEKSRAYGAITRLASSVARMEAQQDSDWFETEVFYAAVGLVRAVEGPLRDRVLGGITQGMTGNWTALARGLREGVGQGWLGSRMFIDVRRIAARVEQDAAAAPAAWTSCKTRIQHNVEILAGAIGTEAPMLLRLGS